MAQISRESQAQIAKELTLAICSQIGPSDTSSVASMNESLAQNLAEAYSIIYKKVKEVTE